MTLRDKYTTAVNRKDWATALPLLQEAIRKEDSYAMGVLAAMYAMGNGVPKDPVEASLWFRQSAVRGDPGAQSAFAVCLIKGLGVEKDLGQAAYFLVQAARKDRDDAIKILADMALVNKDAVAAHIALEEVGRLEMARIKRAASQQRTSVARH
jgi:hypothetical protein